MANFNFYLNRAGVRGLPGVKGDPGDSPIITVQTETPNEYILKITNPDGTELISPNLRGNKININEGTYVRYNTETGELYTSTADGATGELAGVVRLATDADITDMDEKSVVTPSQLADALSQYLVSPDGSVKIAQNAENSLTELTVESTGQVIDQLKSDVSTLQNEVSVLNTEIDTKSPKLTAGENITLTPQDDGTIKVDSTGGLTELPIATATTLGGVKIGNNLTITEDGTLSATGGSTPTNMVTTDTEQVIQSIKLFRHPKFDSGFTQIQGASISLLRYDREEVGRIDMGTSSKGITFYCAGQDNMVFQMDGTSTRYFDFLAPSGNIMNRMRYYGSGNYYDIFNAGNLIPSSNITISEASATGVHTIDISQTLLDRITALEEQIGEISAQLDEINGEVI